MLIAVALVVLALAASPVLQRYYVQNDNGGKLLWNEKEAYLFMNVNQRGFHFSYLGFAWVVFKEYFNVVPFPDDERLSATVVHVALPVVERHALDLANSPVPPDFETPFGGRIYANCQGVPCKWTGDTFEPATEDEKRMLDGTNRLSLSDFAKDASGWSRRTIACGLHDYQFSVELRDQGTLSVKVKSPEQSPYCTISIDVLRAGQNPESIWHLDSHPRLVGRAEYYQSFRRR
ncbi:MAG: hypothetical protein WCC22_09215 [Terriglobales bacterium]